MKKNPGQIFNLINIFMHLNKTKLLFFIIKEFNKYYYSINLFFIYKKIIFLLIIFLKSNLYKNSKNASLINLF